MNDLVVCSGLTKRFGALTALDHVDLHLNSGRIVGLLGPNGSGKTTLIKLMSGLLRPTEGNISIAGYPIGPQSKAVVAYLPDKMFYANWMKAEDLIESLRAHGNETETTAL